ncbi:MAG: hypothetical protein KKD29_04745 [Candidatus Omnitrophica bacterium]|nr:hypothetical protein [Candidatus Omnitrophota bacterium]MBU4487952.1 hypothetical protein [Candidatus Omnitrophota bacterium]MCG2704547.1 hypothetical protein [Candidatus Omnitrophota bacterium]
MRNKTFDDYSPAHLVRLRRVLAGIYIAFGHVSKNFYLVGGLVPDLLVTNKLPYLKEYLGTLDIDIAIKFAVAERGKYKDFYKIMRSMGFEKQKTGDGLDFMSHSFIKFEGGYKPIVIDLITDNRFKPAADKLKEIAPDVEAVKFRGVYLVFNDFIERDIGSSRKRAIKIKIPNVIPFLTLKAFAYSDEENSAAKDAYDIWYTIVNFKNGPVSVKEELTKYKGNKDVGDAFKAIHRYFDGEDSAGTKDVVNILTNRYGLNRTFAVREVIYSISQLFVK